MTNNGLFSTTDLFAYHKVTGCRVMNAKTVLLSMEPELRSRVFRAVLGQPGERAVLSDPIENDAAARELVDAAARTAEGL